MNNFFKTFFTSMVRGWSIVLGLMVIACSSPTKEAKEDDLIKFKLVKVFPHDVTAFTQGLVVANGKLYESTGQAGSWISEVDIATGKQNKKVILDKKYFGEGITILNNKIYQLTWQHKVGFVYDLRTFIKVKEFHYDHEGWGITHNGVNLIVSDGTDRLHFLDSGTVEEIKVLTVKNNGQPVSQLNELEFVEGFIYANQWQTSYILKIDPANGQVRGRLDLSSLNDEVLQFNVNPDVLNGIAYEKNTKTFMVTGKLWPVLFAFRLEESPQAESNAP